MIKTIAKLREQHGVTQAELAKLIGVTSRTIQNWEYGKTQPRLNEWLKITELLEKK
jgi:DNA-binding XRE family transcriptional regulator